MDKITDLWKSFKERISNPLFSSFIFAWILCNWKITIALLWYDTKEIEELGFKTIFAFIEANLNPWDSFKLPLYTAIGYTVAMPFIKVAMDALKSVATRL